MDGLTVSALARRSGVPASTVRYYEQQGLMPARRSPAGYRLYDEVAVDRLAFIGSGKSLGLPLPEIRRLLQPWAHGRCADVQHELAPLLERRLAATHERVRELRAFADRLGRARAQLDAVNRDGPCDPSCVFLGRAERHPEPAGPMREPVIACSLDGTERAARVRRWHGLLLAVTGCVAVPGGVRLTFDRPRLRLAALVELAEAESQCCPFLDLAVRLGPPVELEARAPEHALAQVHELFGEPAA